MVDMPGMQGGSVKIRRGRRTDFPALISLLAPAEASATDKAQIRHWRKLASDPGHDFYVAEHEGSIQGMVLVSYIRGLRHPGWQAVLDMVVSSAVIYSIGQELLDFAKGRARKRGCRSLLAWQHKASVSESFLLCAQRGF